MTTGHTTADAGDVLFGLFHKPAIQFSRCQVSRTPFNLLKEVCSSLRTEYTVPDRNMSHPDSFNEEEL